LATNLKEWVLEQLEEELDGTNQEIILKNLDLLSSIGIETYNIDIAMLKLLDQRDKNVIKLNIFCFVYSINIFVLLKLIFKEKVSEFLSKIANVDQSEIKIALGNMKKLQVFELLLLNFCNSI
jgi:hypothetical protein